MDRTLLTRDLIEATTMGAASLVDPQRLSRRTRPAYRLAVAAVSGVATNRVLREESELMLNPVSRAAVALGTAGTIFGTMGLWERVDASTHRWLVRRGVKHPRLVLAGAAFLTSLVPALMDRRRGADSPDGLDDVNPRHEPLDPALRDVLRAILGATEEYGATSLRGQLADAVVETWSESLDPDDPKPEYVQLKLNHPDQHERVRPLSLTFPVRARTPDGHEIFVGISDGLLDHVYVDHPVRPDRPASDEQPPLTAWPTLAETTLVSDDEAATELGRRS